MGARLGSVCYADAMSAAQAQCSELVGVTDAGLLRCIGVDGSPESPTLSISFVPAEGEPLTRSVAFVAPACDPFEAYADMGQMWGLMVVALVGVWALRAFVLRLVLPQ